MSNCIMQYIDAGKFVRQPELVSDSSLGYQHIKVKVVMNEVKMTESRAGEIALAIIQYRSTKKKIEIDPKDKECWVRIARKYDSGIPQIQDFFMHVILPITIQETFSVVGGLSGIENEEQRKKFESIALKIVRNEPIDLNPNYGKEWFEGISNGVKKYATVSVNELREFYITFVIPYILKKIMDWDSCSITGSRK